MNIIRVSSMAIVTALLFQASAQAVDVGEMDVEIDLKAVSAYVWRGMILNDEPCAQPSINIMAGDFALDVWGTWDLTDVTNSSSRTRMDITLDYTKIIGRSSFKAGVISYIYHDDSHGRAKDTFEATFDYAFEIPGTFTVPSLTANYDFGEIKGVYATLGIGQGIPLVDKIWDMYIMLLLSGGDANYVNYHFNPTDPEGDELDTSLVDFEARVVFPYMTVVDKQTYTITPSVKYMTLVGSDIKDMIEAENGETDEIVYSLSIAFAF